MPAAHALRLLPCLCRILIEERRIMCAHLRTGNSKAVGAARSRPGLGVPQTSLLLTRMRFPVCSPLVCRRRRCHKAVPVLSMQVCVCESVLQVCVYVSVSVWYVTLSVSLPCAACLRMCQRRKMPYARTGDPGDTEPGDTHHTHTSDGGEP